MVKKKVIIISHRRSGTHLTIDVVRKKIFEGGNYLNIDSYIDFESKIFDIESFEKEASNINVFKTHLIPDFSQYISDGQICDYLTNFFDDNLKIYVSRNGKDVMVSLYHYMKNFDKKVKEMSFSNFLQTNNTFDPSPSNFSRVKFWNYHVKTWLKKENILVLNYEELIASYENVLLKIEKHLEIPLKEVFDLRLKSTSLVTKYINQLLIKLKINKINSAVGFRKGKVNDYVNHFNPKDYDFYNSEINENSSHK